MSRLLLDLRRLYRRAGCGRAPTALVLAALATMVCARTLPAREIVLDAPPSAVLDGDTFTADLDGDGRLEEPRERVRLLHVDTPELGESHKGRDRAHGLPARAFLREALAVPPLRLEVPDDRPTGNYGRTLAVVYAGGRNVNLALVRAGHSYFDTRFGFPPDTAAYLAYAAAEAEAFAAGRGIWREPASRQRYLERLRDEQKTPAAESNPLYGGGPYDAATFDPAPLLGRYVRLTSRVAEVRRLSKGVVLLRLARDAGSDFPAVVFRHRAAHLPLADWGPWTPLYLEGFLKRYRRKPELVVHYAAAVAP